jgi:ubiquinol-cytochrome c reductase cytochrome b subunit
MAAGNFEKYKSDGSLAVTCWSGLTRVSRLLRCGRAPVEYYAPKNFNFWYFFGSLALLVLVIQIVTGIFLVMHYKPDAALNAKACRWPSLPSSTSCATCPVAG